MNDKSADPIHWSFWAIGGVALIWNLMGGINFFMQMSEEMVASMPETHQAIIASRPAWATAAFAVAVYGGALGCILLLLKKPAAVYLFIASLLAVIATTIQALGVIGSSADLTFFEIVMMMVMPLVVAAFLIWYAKWTERKGWVG